MEIFQNAVTWTLYNRISIKTTASRGLTNEESMDNILQYYNKTQIATICDVQPKTVYNWFKNINMPYWALYKLGFRIPDKPESIELTEPQK
jgi:hypothetical protein